jgi:hypothetical protein
MPSCSAIFMFCRQLSLADELDDAPSPTQGNELSPSLREFGPPQLVLYHNGCCGGEGVLSFLQEFNAHYTHLVAIIKQQ